MQSDNMAFWRTPRKGANLFNVVETTERFAAARTMGLEYIRLTPSKWKGSGRDFLLGDADNFKGIPPKDWSHLSQMLDNAAKHRLKVILVPLSLPGCRWRQQNGNTNDLRLWQDTTYHQQTAAFWQELARKLKGHPAVYGYNLLNEPTPEMVGKYGGFEEKDPMAWASKVRGTPADLNGFYKKIITAIREIDQDTPIVLDSAEYASPLAFPALERQNDSRILYSFHMYEPYSYTNFKENQGRFTYPGLIEHNGSPKEMWNIAKMRLFLRRIRTWADANNVPPAQIMVGEFGVNRRVAGAERYVEDLVRLFNEYRWHWAFYSFREDEWEGMDYELGSGKLPAAYWYAQEKQKSVQMFRRGGPIWDVIQREFKPKADY
jgi:endoglucanase